MHGVLDGHHPLAVPLQPCPGRAAGHAVAQVQRRKAAVSFQQIVFIIEGSENLAAEHVHPGAPGAFLHGVGDDQVLQHAVLGHFRPVHVQGGKIIHEGIPVLGKRPGFGGVVQGLRGHGAGLVALGPPGQLLQGQGGKPVVLAKGGGQGQKHQGKQQAKQAFQHSKLL